MHRTTCIKHETTTKICFIKKNNSRIENRLLCHLLPGNTEKLAHYWCSDMEISTVAAKRDDTEVTIALWDERITLI